MTALSGSQYKPPALPEVIDLNRIKLLAKARAFAHAQAGIESKRVLDVLG